MKNPSLREILGDNVVLVVFISTVIALDRTICKLKNGTENHVIMVYS